MARSSKVYDFVLVLKTTGHGLVNRISQMMMLLSVAIFLFVSFPLKQPSIFTLLVVAGIVGWWIYAYIRFKKGTPVYYRIALFIAAIGWYKQPGGIWMAVIYVIAGLLEKQAKFPQEIAFDDEEVVFNSFPKRHYPWTLVKNVVLKDGILTIDFKDNKLLQKELDSAPVIKDEIEFNEFCAAHLLQQSN